MQQGCSWLLYITLFAFASVQPGKTVILARAAMCAGRTLAHLMATDKPANSVGTVGSNLSTRPRNHAY